VLFGKKLNIRFLFANSKMENPTETPSTAYKGVLSVWRVCEEIDKEPSIVGNCVTVGTLLGAFTTGVGSVVGAGATGAVVGIKKATVVGMTVGAVDVGKVGAIVGATVDAIAGAVDVDIVGAVVGAITGAIAGAVDVGIVGAVVSAITGASVGVTVRTFSICSELVNVSAAVGKAVVPRGSLVPTGASEPTMVEVAVGVGVAGSMTGLSVGS
jgi:hypothetical protein